LSDTCAVMSPAHGEGIEGLLAMCASNGLDLEPFASPAGESKEEMASRFLRARKGKVDAAYDMLSRDIEWRKREGIQELVNLPVAKIAGVEEEVLFKYFPAWHQGFDKEGRPVLYTAYGNCEVDTLCKMGASVESLLTYHVYQQETCVRLLASQSQRLGRKVEKFFFVIDAKGWGLRLWTRQAMRFIKGMADCDSAHYPERLGQMYVINCPRALVLTYRVISSWTDPETASKIRLLGGPDEWQHLLLNAVDSDSLCSLYGGKSPPPFDPSKMAGYSEGGMRSVTVGARAEMKLPVTVNEGDYLSWAYKTEAHDIKFAVYYAPPGEAATTKSQVVHAAEKHKACGNEVSDTIETCRAGTYLLVWDNSYSMLTSKNLSYRIENGAKIDENAALNGSRT